MKNKVFVFYYSINDIKVSEINQEEDKILLCPKEVSLKYVM